MRMKRPLVLLTLFCLIFAAKASANDRSYDRSYENQFLHRNHPQVQEPFKHQQANRHAVQQSGQRLHDEALNFMNKARNGQLSPEHRQMFNSVQQQANDLVRRLQNGQLTPQERSVYEAVQRQMRNPLTY